MFIFELEKVRRIGKVSVMSDMSIREENMFITFIWSCTNFLVPKTNGLLLSYKSQESREVKHGGQELAVLVFFLGK